MPISHYANGNQNLPMSAKLNRKKTMQALVAQEGGIAAFARRVKTDPSYISQILSESMKKPRQCGDRLAEQIEAAFGKPKGWMDESHPGLWGEDLAPGAGQPANQVRETPASYTTQRRMDPLVPKLVAALDNPRMRALLSSVLTFVETPAEARPLTAPEIRTLVKALAQTIEAAMAGTDPEERDPGVIAQAAVARYMALMDGESIEVELQRVSAALVA